MQRYDFIQKSQKRIKIGVTQKKILLLLLAGVALAFNRSPSRALKIISQIPEELKKIDKQALGRSTKSLCDCGLVDIKESKDGTINLILTKECEEELRCLEKIEKMKIKKPKKWDGKWRVIISDIPEKLRPLRDSLRNRLNRLKFSKLQKSAFVHPFPCEEEIKFLIDFYEAHRYVRIIVADKIDNEAELKKKFGLS